MKVVILKTGEIKEVANGYARHHLLPQKLAVSATDDAVKQAEIKQKTLQEESQKKKDKERKMLDSIKDQSIEIKSKANKEGKLFAAISTSDIKKALKEQLKVDFPENYFKLKKQLKTIGEHQVDIETDFDIKVKLSLEITNLT